jgi:undecaprenyl-diphosphatase
MLKGYEAINADNIGVLIFGNVVGFVVALFAIRSFISYLTKHGFAIFGYYRIVVGVLILVLYFFGVNLSID